MSWENRKHISERTANRSMSSRKMCSSWGDSRAAGVGARREAAWPRLTRGFIARPNSLRVYGRHVHTRYTFRFSIPKSPGSLTLRVEAELAGYVPLGRDRCVRTAHLLLPRLQRTACGSMTEYT